MRMQEFSDAVAEIVSSAGEGCEAREATIAKLRIFYESFSRTLHVAPQRGEARKIYLAAVEAVRYSQERSKKYDIDRTESKISKDRG